MRTALLIFVLVTGCQPAPTAATGGGTADGGRSCLADGEGNSFSPRRNVNPPRLPCCSGFEINFYCDCEGAVSSICSAPPDAGSLGIGEWCRANEDCESGFCAVRNFCPPVVCPRTGQCLDAG
jgi:hypothetical protein